MIFTFVKDIVSSNKNCSSFIKESDLLKKLEIGHTSFVAIRIGKFEDRISLSEHMPIVLDINEF